MCMCCMDVWFDQLMRDGARRYGVTDDACRRPVISLDKFLIECHTQCVVIAQKTIQTLALCYANMVC